MLRFLLAAALLSSTAFAQTPPPAAPATEPTLDQMALDGVRTCMSIAAGRAPADAAGIFSFTASGELFTREIAAGKVEILPPSPDRTSCRTQVYAISLDDTAFQEAVQTFLTTPPQSYAPYQSRIAEQIGGGYWARTSIWASSDGKSLGQVTLYEILANEYYHGPKMLIDFIVNKRS